MNIIRTLVAMTLLTGAALAHDLWLMPSMFQAEPGQTVQVRIEVGERFPISDAAMKADRIEKFVATLDGRQTPLENIRTDGTALVGEFTPARPGLYTIACVVKPRNITIEAADFNNYLQHDGMPDVFTRRSSLGEADTPGRERYTRTVTTLVEIGAAPANKAQTPLGETIEIVPGSNPLALKAGDSLTVRLLFRGKPLANHLIASMTRGGESHFIQELRTGADGRATFRLDRTGPWCIRSINMLRAPEDDEEVDWESFWATMTFSVKEAAPATR